MRKKEKANERERERQDRDRDRDRERERERQRDRETDTDTQTQTERRYAHKQSAPSVGSDLLVDTPPFLHDNEAFFGALYRSECRHIRPILPLERNGFSGHQGCV